MKVSARCLLLLLTLILGSGFSSVRAQVQATSGSIQGDVTDSAGAAIPGASVEADEVDTAAIRQALTDDAGHFEFPSLQPGR